MLIDIRDITKVYEMGEQQVHALSGVTWASSGASTSRSWAPPARASRPS